MKRHCIWNRFRFGFRLICPIVPGIDVRGDKVRVLDPGEVSSCRELGKTSTSVTWVVLGVPRPEDVISKELRIVARNSASRLGGDTIVPLTVIEKGEQTFVVYKCVNPDG